MRVLVAASLVCAQVGAYRIRHRHYQEPGCECATTTIVNGVHVGHAGCDQHFGSRFGYVCYVTGTSCPTARESHSHRGAFWRSCATEHYRDEAKQYLLDAMETIEEDDIRRTMAIAVERGVDQATIDAANARIEEIHEMGRALDELKNAIGRLDYDQMQAALTRVEELELDEFLSEEALEKAVAHFSFLGRRREALNELAEAIDSFSLDDLMTALAEAREYRAEDDVLQQGEERVAELQRLRTEAATELAASVATRDMQRVSEAILEVERLDAVDASVMTEARDRLQHLVLMVEARDSLLLGIQGHDLDEINDRLARATELDVEPEVLSLGQERVAHLVAMRDSVIAVEAAIAGRDSQVLRDAVAEAQRLEAIDDVLDSRAQARLATLVVIDEATNELRSLFNSDDSRAVRHALERAREVGVDDDIIEEGDRTRRRISRLKHDLRKALIENTESGTDPVELQRLIDECGRLHAASHRRIEAAERRLASLR